MSDKIITQAEALGMLKVCELVNYLLEKGVEPDGSLVVSPSYERMIKDIKRDFFKEDFVREAIDFDAIDKEEMLRNICLHGYTPYEAFMEVVQESEDDFHDDIARLWEKKCKDETSVEAFFLVPLHYVKAIKEEKQAVFDMDMLPLPVWSVTHWSEAQKVLGKLDALRKEIPKEDE